MCRKTGIEKLSRPPSFAAGFFAVNFFPLLFLTTTTR